MAWDINNLVHGDNLMLYLTNGQEVLAYATSCSVEISSDSLDVSSKFSCKWGSSLAGKLSYTISADALYYTGDGISFDDLLAYQLSQKPVKWVIGEAEDESETPCKDRTYELKTSAPYYNGTAVITSLSLSAGNNEISSVSISMAGSDEIQQSGLPIKPEVDGDTQSNG